MRICVLTNISKHEPSSASASFSQQASRWFRKGSEQGAYAWEESKRDLKSKAGVGRPLESRVRFDQETQL